MDNKLTRFLEKFKVKYQINKNNRKLNIRNLLSEDIQNEFTDEELKGFFSKQDSLSAILDSLNQIDAKPDTTKNIETDSSEMHNLLDNTGMIPGPTGMVSDVANAGLYFKEGNVKQGLLSSLYATPFLGEFAGGIKKVKNAKQLELFKKKKKVIVKPTEGTEKAVNAMKKNDATRAQDKLNELAKSNDEKGFYEAVERANRKAADNINAEKEANRILQTFKKMSEEGISGAQKIVDIFTKLN